MRGLALLTLLSFAAAAVGRPLLPAHPANDPAFTATTAQRSLLVVEQSYETFNFDDIQVTPDVAMEASNFPDTHTAVDES
ncbi:hypothetical protein HaLaN_08378, partial [Haematococcus lacustris]